MWMLKHKDNWRWANSLPVREVEILTSNIFQWVSMVKDAYKVKLRKSIKVKTNIFSTMQTINLEARIEILRSGLKDLWVVRRMPVYLLEMVGNNFICSNASNSIIKLLSKLEIRTTTTCIKRCQASLLTQFNQIDKLNSQQVWCIINTNQRIDSA